MYNQIVKCYPIIIRMELNQIIDSYGKLRPLTIGAGERLLGQAIDAQLAHAVLDFGQIGIIWCLEFVRNELGLGDFLGQIMLKLFGGLQINDRLRLVRDSGYRCGAVAACRSLDRVDSGINILFIWQLLSCFRAFQFITVEFDWFFGFVILYLKQPKNIHENKKIK